MPEMGLLVEYEDKEGRHSEYVPIKQYDKWLINKLFKGKIKIISTEYIAGNEQCLPRA